MVWNIGVCYCFDDLEGGSDVLLDTMTPEAIRQNNSIDACDCIWVSRGLQMHTNMHNSAIGFLRRFSPACVWWPLCAHAIAAPD